MKVKISLLFFLLLSGQPVGANMSSPIWEGTMTGSAVSSKDINIISERILLKIDPSFTTADFVVEYYIQSDFSGRQIPLLFYAKDFKDGFSVWLDDKKISVQNVPIKHHENSPFNGFAKALKQDAGEDKITIYWQKNSGYTCNLTDLKYFEADIEKGNHKIRVEYTANVWTNLSGWVKEFSFRYSLTPAKYWKSFGSLEIIVEQEGQPRELTTNLGLPNGIPTKSTNSWKFNKLPGEYFEISYSPKPNNIANVLLKIEPFGLSLVATTFMAAFHLILTIAYRRKNIQKKYSPSVIFGSIFVPFLSLLAYIYSYDIIDNAIGDAASRRHGYVFLSIVLYPVFLTIYWLIFWLIDKIYKKNLLNEAGNR